MPSILIDYATGFLILGTVYLIVGGLTFTLTAWWLDK